MKIIAKIKNSLILQPLHYIFGYDDTLTKVFTKSDYIRLTLRHQSMSYTKAQATSRLDLALNNKNTLNL